MIYNAQPNKQANTRISEVSFFLKTAKNLKLL